MNSSLYGTLQCRCTELICKQDLCFLGMEERDFLLFLWETKSGNFEVLIRMVLIRLLTNVC